jgi:hypothetical protein
MRVLKLAPGKPEDDIKCTLQTISLESSLCRYEALSYVWGNPDDTVDITCNGQRLAITVSLDSALRHFRDPKEPRTLWADAVCINQTDDTEKGHQVKRMDKVYENARKVLAWVGEDPEGIAEDCFALVRETNLKLDKQIEEKGIRPDLVDLSEICTDRSRWWKVGQLSRLSWFKRVW